MSSWAERNRAYLLAVCKGLRLRLRRLIDGDAVTLEMIDEAAAAIAEAAAVDPPPAAIVLSDRFHLSELELGVLLLCVVMEIDPLIPELCDQAQGGKGWMFPTFALGFQLFEDVQWDVMSIDAPLRHWRLIHLHAPQPQPLPQTMLKADERIVNHIMGAGQLDERLASVVMPLMPARLTDERVPLAPSQQAVVEDVCHCLSQWNRVPVPIVQLLGSDTHSKHHIAHGISAQFGMGLYGLMGELIPTANADFAEFLRLWDRETYLAPVALYIDTQEVSLDSVNRVALRRFLSQSCGLMVVDSREVRLPPNRQAITREVAKPTALEQRQFWTEALGPGAEEQAALLTSQFSLNGDEIGEIAGSNKLQVTSNELRVASDEVGEEVQNSKFKIQNSGSSLLWNACLNRTRPRLESLAQRVDVKATWDQLVLPGEAMGILRQLVDQVRLRGRVYDDWGFRERMNRGFGVSAMFAGPSGTGKTMAAEVLANELNLHLYRIDLSSVVSKYIGETEKNLRRLFDAAEEGGAILFFDEADALFGKRSEVKDSHDRYANVEINYLLQRIESYRGVAILATNLKASLDVAFKRRLRFLIDFPFPSQEYRQQLWRKVFPAKISKGVMNYGYLGKFNITGGTIHTVALNAAFMAAEQGESVGMAQVLAALRTEYQKLDRQIYGAEFQWGDARDETSWELSRQKARGEV